MISFRKGASGQRVKLRSESSEEFDIEIEWEHRERIGNEVKLKGAL